MTSTNNDQITRFIFENHSVRGLWIELSDSLEQLKGEHQYPETVQKQLLEAALAANLLAATIKFEGRLTMQAQSGGELSLLLIQANHDHYFRGIARHNGTVTPSDNLKQLMPGAQMAITIEPENGKRYQGIVPMHQSNLSANLEDYFKQSEQLETRIWLFSDGTRGAGLMLQAMPGATPETDFDHLAQLAQTLSKDEALTLTTESILHRLFHQDPLRVFPPKPVEYRCGCSRNKSLASMTLVPKEELLEILQQEGQIAVNCEFCHTKYTFDTIDIEQIFANSGHNMQPDQIQ